MALIQRRFNFCRVKLDSMRAELEEAKAIGLIDLAADLQSAVSKFEDMHLDATKGLELTRAEVAEVEHVRKILARGTSAHRQLELRRRLLDEGKSEAEADRAVIAHLVEETARGVPHNGAKS